MTKPREISYVVWSFLLLFSSIAQAQETPKPEYYQEDVFNAYYCELHQLSPQPETGTIAGSIQSDFVKKKDLIETCISIWKNELFVAGVSPSKSANYKIKHVPEGTYSVHMEWKELKETTHEVVVRKGETSFVNFWVVDKKKNSE